MEITKSLRSIDANEQNFPVFFHVSWFKHEESCGNKCKLFFSNFFDAVVPLKTNKAKFLIINTFLYVPLTFNGERLNKEIEKLFLEELVSFLKENKLGDVLLPPGHFVNFQAVPKNCSFYELGIISVRLKCTVDEIFSSFHPNYRNEIRKIKGSELNFENNSSDLTLLNSLVDNSLSAGKVNGKNADYIKQLWNHLRTNINVSLLKNKSIGVSGVLCLFDSKIAYYLYSGNAYNKSYPGANKYLLFEIMKTHAIEGREKLILGGFRPYLEKNSKLDKIQKFKLKFGGEIEEGYHFYCILNPMKFWFFNIAASLLSRVDKKDRRLIITSGLKINKSA